MFVGALGKARGHLMRLSTILEDLWWSGEYKGPEPEVISQRAVEAAAGLLDSYFIPMAERVFGDASIPLVERNAMMLIRHVKRSGQGEFNAKTMRRDIGGPLRESAAMAAACEVLCEAGLIRQPTGKAPGPGRPAKNYKVNPVVLGVAP